MKNWNELTHFAGFDWAGDQWRQLAGILHANSATAPVCEITSGRLAPKPPPNPCADDPSIPKDLRKNF